MNQTLSQSVSSPHKSRANNTNHIGNPKAKSKPESIPDPSPPSHSPLYDEDEFGALFSSMSSQTPPLLESDLFSLSIPQDDEEDAPLTEVPVQGRKRGRPKGSKNKNGHRAGRPKGGLEGEDASNVVVAEDASTKPSPAKRPRKTASVPMVPVNSLPLHDHQVQQQQQLSASTSVLQSPPLQHHHISVQPPHAFHLIPPPPHQPQTLSNPMQLSLSRPPMSLHHDSHALAGDIPVLPLPTRSHEPPTSAPPATISIPNLLSTHHERFLLPPNVPFSLASPISTSMVPLISPTSPSATSASAAPAPPPPFSCPPIAEEALAYFNRSSNVLPVPFIPLPVVEPSPPNSLLQSSSTPPLSRASSAMSSSLSADAAVPTKSKGKAKLTEEEELRNLLPRDFRNSMPAISGPFQLVPNEGGKRKLAGPISPSTLDQHPGPVYVYIANYHPSVASAPPSSLANVGESSSVPLAKQHSGFASVTGWHKPSGREEDAKPFARRGPRRCGHCGDVDCKGRGGRALCPQLQNGLPPYDEEDEEADTTLTYDSITSSQAPQMHSSYLSHQSLTHSPIRQHSLDSSRLSDRSYSMEGPRLGPERSYSALANFRGDASSSNMINLNIHASHNLVHTPTSMAAPPPPPSPSHLRPHLDPSTFYDLGNTNDEVLSLIERMTSQSHHHPTSTEEDHQDHSAFFSTFASTEVGAHSYDDPIAAFEGQLYEDGSGMDIVHPSMYEDVRDEELPHLRTSSVNLERSPGKTVKPRSCHICGSRECQGKIYRFRCPNFVEEIHARKKGTHG